MALLLRTKPNRPPLQEAEVMDVLKSFNGILLSPVAVSGLPEMLAGMAYFGMIEEPEAEPLRREIEDVDYDPEFAEMLTRTPPAKRHEKLRSLSSDAALSVVVSALFWWGHRDLCLSELAPAKAPGTFRTGLYFSLTDSRNLGSTA